MGASALAAFLFFVQRQVRTIEAPTRLAELRQVNTVADYIFDQSTAAHLAGPRVAVDYITDALDAQVLRVICYERHHVWRDLDMRLPTGIAEPDAALVRERIAESDFIFLADDDAPLGSFPYDRKLAELRPELRVWCRMHMRPAMHFSFSGHAITLYERPSFPIRMPQLR